MQSIGLQARVARAALRRGALSSVDFEQTGVSCWTRGYRKRGGCECHLARGWPMVCVCNIGQSLLALQVNAVALIYSATSRL